MSDARYGHTGLHSIQMPQTLVCRECVIIWDTDREVFLDDPAVFL